MAKKNRVNNKNRNKAKRRNRNKKRTHDDNIILRINYAELGNRIQQYMYALNFEAKVKNGNVPIGYKYNNVPQPLVSSGWM
jgi:hypothetical protein